MYARVARWEGGEAEAMRSAVARIKENAESGPPEGVPSTGFTFLIDPESGRGMAVGLFETLDDLKQGDAVLNEMSPPDDGMGRRTAVEVYEVGFETRL